MPCFRGPKQQLLTLWEVARGLGRDLVVVVEKRGKALGSNTGHLMIGTVDGRNPAPVDMVNFTIYRVLYIPGGAGLLPLTVGKFASRNLDQFFFQV